MSDKTPPASEQPLYILLNPKSDTKKAGDEFIDLHAFAKWLPVDLERKREFLPNCIYRRASLPKAPAATPTIDLERLSWEAIKLAASESNWIPKDHYFQNDWVSDVCQFLRGQKPAATTGKSDEEIAAHYAMTIAEDIGDVSEPWLKLQILCALREARQQTSFGVETPPAMEQPNAETGVLPCPFCGSKDAIPVDLSLDDPWFVIQCGKLGKNGCGASVGSTISYAVARRHWNDRASLTSSSPQTLADTSVSHEKQLPVDQPKEQQKWTFRQSSSIVAGEYSWPIYEGDRVIADLEFEVDARNICAAHNASLGDEQKEQE